MKSHRRSASGLSLVELMIASVVVAAAGTLLASGLMISNRGAARHLQQMAATRLLANRVALLDDHVTGAAGELSGTFAPPQEAFHWTQHWEQVAGPLHPLARTTLTVSDGTYSVHVITYLPVTEP